MNFRNTQYIYIVCASSMQNSRIVRATSEVVALCVLRPKLSHFARYVRSCRTLRPTSEVVAFCALRPKLSDCARYVLRCRILRATFQIVRASFENDKRSLIYTVSLDKFSFISIYSGQCMTIILTDEIQWDTISRVSRYDCGKWWPELESLRQRQERAAAVHFFFVVHVKWNCKDVAVLKSSFVQEIVNLVQGEIVWFLNWFDDSIRKTLYPF